MSYHDAVSALSEDAEQLEQIYHAALKAGDADAFKQAIDDSHTSTPENLLYAAWFHRLRYTAARAKGYAVAWAWVIPLAVANGLLFWWLSDDRFMITIRSFRGTHRDFMPATVLLAASLSAVFVLIYLTVVGRKRWHLSALIGILLLAAGAYVLLTYPQTGPAPFQEQYLTLMAMHLPLLAWAGVGAFLIARHRDAANRFSFLIKSLEVFILGGLFVIAGGLFTAITIGLFDALGVDFPDVVQRLFIAGGAGLIPVVATPVIYNPTVPPAEQAFDEGLSRLVALLMRILLPLTLLVLFVYLAFIPFNFRAPFENRDVLIIYNGMLFAVIALLVGATPVSLADISPRLARWLRLGIIAVATLALIVSLYALAAIVYRTALDRLTPNRLTFIGWNVVNIGLLCLVLLFQARAKAGRWLQGLYRAYSAGTVAYAVWTLAMILAIPWLFGINQGEVEALPETVQQMIFDRPPPILLKCPASPHIYFLDQGKKRWIEDIETFNDRGYVWRDVQSIPCDDLRSIPDGVPIPANAGPPPQP
ncbi:MAG TPA: hypothetical protein VLY63_05395 [Anaerolineae bacterium]|nr:hypothetical protein [Anaerolineae bacterium]